MNEQFQQPVLPTQEIQTYPINLGQIKKPAKEKRWLWLLFFLFLIAIIGFGILAIF